MITSNRRTRDEIFGNRITSEDFSTSASMLCLPSKNNVMLGEQRNAALDLLLKYSEVGVLLKISQWSREPVHTLNQASVTKVILG